ncbi:MAG: hypothetical protein RIR51_183 [Bacteroidota bacterium]|jgi:hypothetical protein
MGKFLLFLLLPFLGISQHVLDLSNLNDFENPSKNWTIQNGRILTNKLLPKDNQDLISKLKHGDIHLKFEYRIPEGSNSGIYLQGRYEVQILDSWKKEKVKYYDNGGIYERWDDSRGKGKEGYEGYAPTENASKAPGLWQSLEIDFQAPRFNENGKKIANAKFKKVILNGVLIHQNIEVSGVTRGSLFPEEAIKGPIRIQGDHGGIEIRNFWYETFDLPSIKLTNIQFKTYQSEKENQIKTFNIDGLEPVQIGTSDKLDQQLIEPKANFLTDFQGELEAPASEDYLFELYFTGSAQLWLDGKKYFEAESWYNTKNEVSVPISKGKHQLDIVYVKDFPWGPKALGVYVKRVGSEKIALHERTSLPEPEAIGMIEYKVGQEPLMQRSFMFEGEVKNTYVISVGTPNRLHYSYDLKKGDLIYVWRGKFLDVTQMWHDRGEPQTAAPLGQVENIFGGGNLLMGDKKLTDSWIYKGYTLKDGLPIYHYKIEGGGIDDKIIPNKDNSGLSRTISNTSGQSLNIVLAKGNSIVKVGESLWDIDGEYFIKVNSSSSRVEGGRLMDSLEKGDYTYEIVW